MDVFQLIGEIIDFIMLIRANYQVDLCKLMARNLYIPGSFLGNNQFSFCKNVKLNLHNDLHNGINFFKSEETQ